MAWIFKNWYYLYSRQTEPELALERALVREGHRYRAQHLFPGLKHIADFALLDVNLIIEVDGASHQAEGQRRKDLTNTLALSKLGWRVLRCTNEEAMRDAEGTVRRLLDVHFSTPLPDLGALAGALRQHQETFGVLSKPRARKPKPPRVSSSPKARKAAKLLRAPKDHLEPRLPSTF